MESVKQRFRRLDTVIEGIHAVFDQFSLNGEFHPGFDLDTVLRAKLAVHEWAANLVQHADFEDRTPDIVLDVWPDGERITCVIEDNSTGFDLDVSLSAKRDDMDSVPERGMGLLMLQACADDLKYTRLEDGRFRLEFSVQAEDDPWLNIPFLS